MKSGQKTLFVWMILIVGGLWIIQVSQLQRPQSKKIPFNVFIEHVKKNQIKEVTFKDHGQIAGKFVESIEGGKEFESIGNTEAEHYIELLEKHGITPNYELDPGRSLWMQFLLSWAPLLLLLVIPLFFLRQLQQNGGKAMSFGRSRAKLLTEGHTKVNFRDVAGCEEAKEELKEVVEFLKDPRKFTKLGGRIPKGVLLVGSPGTGKTLLAKAVAGEAVVPFFSISGSDFVEMFVGVGASRVRDLFEQGKKHAPCIIFIDEIDAVGRQRGAGLGGGHDEREQTLNQLLVEMDGFESKEGVILIAATNRPDVLDPALLRPGRFDRNVVVNKPDVKGREGILKVHTRDMPLSEDVDLVVIAKGTPGFAGADLQNLVNEAALMAGRRNKKKIEMNDFDSAKDKVLMGAERRSMTMNEEEKRMVAYHESGHTIVGMCLDEIDPIHKVTIIPRGMALGVTQTLPDEDRFTLSKDKAEAMISFLMGGHIAEGLVFGQKTTGAGDDISKASDLARKMICEWGMSDVIGPIAIAKKEENVFLGRELSQSTLNVSEKTAQLVDEEIRRTITENYDRATAILQENMDILHSMAKALLDRENLDRSEIDLLMARKSLPPLEVVSPVEEETTSQKVNATPTADPSPEVA